MALPQGGGRKPLGAQAPLSPHGSLLLHNREIYKHLLLLYISISHSILTGVAFCVYAVRCFMRIIERIRRVFVVFS